MNMNVKFKMTTQMMKDKMAVFYKCFDSARLPFQAIWQNPRVANDAQEFFM
jgi:hypothetical protein